jgi:hypothetical protein
MFGFNADNSGEQVGELVERLKSNANLDDAQAKKVLETIKDFIVEKYPMLQGAIDNMLGGK